MLVKELEFKGHKYKIAYRDDIEGHPSWYSFEDEKGVRDKTWNIQPGDVVLDVGAAYGSYTLTALAAGASFVFAWSPQGRPGEETEADTLRESLRLNGWLNRVLIMESGVYDKTGWLHAMTQEFYTEEPPPDPEILKVETLDSWLKTVTLEKVDWMKLDVEGAEAAVLRGASMFIKLYRPKIQVENHVFKDQSLYDQVKLLLTSGQLGVKYKEISTDQHYAVSHSYYEPIDTVYENADESHQITTEKKKRFAFFFHPRHMRAPLDAESIMTSSRGMTGSELTFVNYALEIGKRGHDVHIYTSMTKNAQLNDVNCHVYDDWAADCDKPWDGLVAWMTPEPLKIANPAHYRALNQQVTDFSLCEPGWENYVDTLFVVSQSQADFMTDTCFPKDRYRILYNGTDTSRFRPGAKEPGKMIWASSHDRGLHWLLEMFPKVQQQVPWATLHVFYNRSGLEGFAKSDAKQGIMAELAQRSRYTIEAMNRLNGKGVFVHDSVSRDRIAHEMATAEVLAYPCDPVRYTEAFGVTVLEACASETMPVLCFSDAFSELWGEVAIGVKPPFSKNKEMYLSGLVRLLRNADAREEMAKKAREYAKKFEWSVLADGLEQCLLSQGKTGLPGVKYSKLIPNG